MKKCIILNHCDLDSYGTNITCKIIEHYTDVIRFYIKNCSYKSVNYFGYHALKGTDDFQNLNIKTCDLFLLTDISMSDKMMAWLDKVRNGKAFCLDHHFSTKAYLNDLYPWVQEQEIDDDGEKTCGTLMFFKYAKRNGWLDNVPKNVMDRLETIVYLIRDYDLWLWKENNDLKPKNLNDLLFFYREDKFVDKVVKSVLEDFDFLDKNKSAIEHIALNYRLYKESKKEKVRYSTALDDTFGMKFGYLFAEQYTSELANDLIGELELDAFLIINMDSGTCSLRSREGVDVGSVSKRLGGNGHFCSSGLVITNETLHEGVILEILKQKVDIAI